MQPVQRCVAIGVLVTALAGIGVAYGATNCTYSVHCDYDPNGNNGNGQYNCSVTGVHCTPFNDPDCDASCDAEYNDCTNECFGLSEGSSSCLSACNHVYLDCIRACIPSV